MEMNKTNLQDELICKVCLGKKVVLLENGRPAICPKCAGQGHITIESKDKNKKLILG